MCYPSGKTLFLLEEETWTLPNAKPNTEHEPRGREVELMNVNANCTYITYRLQSNWNTPKGNWYKLKDMYRRRKHKCQQRCQLRVNIFPIKSRHLILTSPWQLSKSYNRENNNLLLFLEPHQISLLICPTRAEIKLDTGTKLKRSCRQSCKVHKGLLSGFLSTDSLTLKKRSLKHMAWINHKNLSHARHVCCSITSSRIDLLRDNIFVAPKSS